MYVSFWIHFLGGSRRDCITHNHCRKRKSGGFHQTISKSWDIDNDLQAEKAKLWGIRFYESVITQHVVLRDPGVLWCQWDPLRGHTV